ncbi:MAG: hypothetical protein KAI66_14240, partial [Lentisphaeria bacterium]|nr:hypothetical protein [Lentisphaeria bacterium]
MTAVFFSKRTLARIVSIVGVAATAGAAPMVPLPEVTAKLQALHRAFEQYRADHDGTYPPLMHKDTAGRPLFWPELLKPYLDDSSPSGRVDPSGPFFAPYVLSEELRAGKVSSVSFGYPRFSLGADAPSYNGGRKPVRIVPNPAATLLLVECDAPKQPGGGWYSAYPNSGIRFNCYQGKAHVLFCDGHVELWTPAQLNVGAKPTTVAPPWNGSLSLNPELTGSVPDPILPTTATQAHAAPPAPSPKKPPPPTPRVARPAESAAVADATHLVTVAHVDKPPIIDGHIGAEEWAQFSAFAGYSSYITQKLAPRDVATFAGYDAKALYLAFVIPLGAGERPNARVTKHDGPVYKEDAVEVILAPGAATDVRQ